MSYELFIGLRYLKAKRKQTFISLITFISIGGVMVGVTALIVVLAVMNGFKEDLRDKILGVTSHVVISRFDTKVDPPAPRLVHNSVGSFIDRIHTRQTLPEKLQVAPLDLCTNFQHPFLIESEHIVSKGNAIVT